MRHFTIHENDLLILSQKSLDEGNKMLETVETNDVYWQQVDNIKEHRREVESQ